ncbi:hypothetical protein [Streptomyces aureocirculatus]|uniref:hypothetical protein n=1 Tax=Streptomyces aureocirculatus TaxID=67275 RepID=UPI000ACF32CD|nr:hypothetical protein [Streptomyces aureocirculatus]
MKNDAPTEKPVTEDASVGRVLYSAEVRENAGKFTLVINDHQRGNVEVRVVPKRAVQKLPFYLSMLSDKLR